MVICIRQNFILFPLTKICNTLFRKCVQKCFLFIGTDNTADGFYAGIAGRLGRKIIEGS